MFKNKLFAAVPIIAIVAIFIFSLTLFPSVQPQPKNLPIAVVNEDEGVTIPGQPKMNIGQTMVEMIQQNTTTDDEDPVVKWIEVDAVEEMKKGLDEREYYAALVIPKDFSAKQASLRTAAPTNPNVEIYINQGMNMAAATMANQILNGLVDSLNSNVRTQVLEGLSVQGATLTVEQAAAIAVPIEKVVENVNETGENSASGNSPISLFQPIWIGSIATAALLLFAASKTPLSSRKEKFMMKLGQIGISIVNAFIIGFGLTWFAGSMVGFTIPNFMDTALFLTITSFSFIMMILAVLSYLGIKGIGIFVLLLFFGAPLLAMAPEMMSAFYRDWIYSWLPMRFMVDGLRELFFFGQGISWNTPTAILVSIAVVGLIVILLSALLPNKLKEQEEA